jgi:hypothetical protein
MNYIQPKCLSFLMTLEKAFHFDLKYLDAPNSIEFMDPRESACSSSGVPADRHNHSVRIGSTELGIFVYVYW